MRSLWSAQEIRDILILYGCCARRRCSWIITLYQNCSSEQFTYGAIIFSILYLFCSFTKHLSAQLILTDHRFADMILRRHWRGKRKKIARTNWKINLATSDFSLEFSFWHERKKTHETPVTATKFFDIVVDVDDVCVVVWELVIFQKRAQQHCISNEQHVEHCKNE